MNSQELPLTQISTRPRGCIPSDKDCLIWWDEFAMLTHIRDHSTCVGHVAETLARLAVRRGKRPSPALSEEDFIQSVRAAGLLHDLGKTWTIEHGGDHSQIGAAWVMDLTGNPTIAQSVMHHVHWPGALDLNEYFLPLAVLYADKRVKHDTFVGIEERFADLMDRYGKTERSRKWIQRTYVQSQELENRLNVFLGEDICAFF